MDESKQKHGSCRWIPNDGIIHCEVEGATINITENLTDVRGRKQTSLQIHPDNDVGDRPWKVMPHVHNIRIIQI